MTPTNPDKDPLLLKVYRQVTGDHDATLDDVPPDAYIMLNCFLFKELRGAVIAFESLTSKHTGRIAERYGITRQGALRHVNRLSDNT